MEYNDLRKLASIAMHADPAAPTAYSFGDEKYTLAQVNEALAAEFRKLAGNYRDYRDNKNTIFRLIEETIDEVLPQRVEQQYAQFAEVKTIGNGDKAIFRTRITEFARKRAKTFVTRVGLATKSSCLMGLV